MRAALLFLGLLTACTPTPAPSMPPTAPPAAAVPPASGEPWQARLDAGHPLVGRVWDTHTMAFVEEATLLAQAKQADFVLLGEKHDNPDHHRLQARVVASLAARKPAVVMEMIDREQQASLDAFLGEHPGDAAGLGGALSWEKRGWPAWSMYQPVAEAALGAGLRLWGGNITAAQARAVVKEGLDSLGAERIDAWGLRAPMDAAARTALEEELNQSHCGHLPAKLLPGMADAQRARDASMADQLLASGGPAVLISGTGHARLDRGAPMYLRARRPGVRVVSVAFREVQAGQKAPGQKGEPFDFLWFTPRLDDEDPCARMGKR